MYIKEFLSELRREPEKNPKIVGHEGAVQKLKQMNNLDNVGISMTKIPKLGINPKSEYDTPIGVYFYPASYYLYIKKNQESLPHEDDASYIQILQWNTSNILEIDKLSKPEYFKLKYKLEEKFGLDKIRSAWEGDNEPLVASPGGYFWYLLWYLTKDEDKPSIAWTKLLRELGIDVVIDNGAGIIHHNEPDQGIVINPKIIRHVDTIQQSYKSLSPNRQWDPLLLSNWAIKNNKPLSPKLEKYLLRNDLAVFQYLINVKPNWSEGVKQIMTDPMYAYKYAYEVLKKPWPEAEPHIVKDLYYAEMYARDVLKDPNYLTWPKRYAKHHGLPDPVAGPIKI